MHRDKPSVLITSPGSPDLHVSPGLGSHSLRQTNVLQRNYSSSNSSTSSQHQHQQQQQQQISHKTQQQRLGPSSSNKVLTSASVSQQKNTTTTAGYHHHHHCQPTASSTSHAHGIHHVAGVSGAAISTHQTSSMPVEGRLQLKLGYDQNTLQLVVTIVCATGLSLRHSSGLPRNPYAKVRIWRICN